MIAFDPSLLLLLFCVALIAGGIDAISGGGGLLVVPALMLAGLSPVAALATNKLQGVFGSGSAAFRFWKAGHIDVKAHLLPAAVCFILALLGGVLAAHIDQKLMARAIPGLLIIIAAYFAFQPKLRAKKDVSWFFLLILLGGVGFYDGIFGPGAGSFYMVILLGFAGLDFLKGTARTKLYNFASNMGAFVLFAAIGTVSWQIGLVMAVGQIIGASIGANLAIKNGARLIHPLLVGMTLLMAARLLWTGIS